ncbi:ABC transporter ATP-binding protein [Amycolatopsis suaedae]|uniref:ABC transporter ATP-binding protein n=1 Tax=Amycolatopsis suaedae TaxID=2510978 RepID=A0A4Q7J6G4_9PSEU|nr:ABC transporter ATP-binding protein [Amycolatopsis suaedae]RZQ61893.1 ABC transporter ATP-binding protein [Amycolatopsis suaedae]
MRRGDRLLAAVAFRDRPRLTLIVTAALIGVAAGLLLPGALADAVDRAVAGESSWPAVAWLLAVGAADIGADALVLLVTARLTASAGAWLRRRLTRHLVTLGTRSRFADGDAVSRLTGDCATASGVTTVLLQLVTATALSTGAIVLLAVLDWRLALVFLGSVPVAMLLARSHLRHTADDVLTYQRVSGEIAARLLDAVRGLRTIAATGTAGQETRRVLRPLPELAGAGAGMWQTQARMVWRAALLLPAVELAVLAAAGFGVAAGRLSVGDVLAALGYVALGMGLVGQIPMLTTLARARSCAQRIAEVLDEPPPHAGHSRLRPGPGHLELRGVTVDGALDGVDLTVPGGTFLAVVGPSGSGKSVLVKTMGGLVTPDGGRVLLDDLPIARMRPEALRYAIGCAFERPALLGTTVADAVAYGTWAGEVAVRAACRAAQVDDLVVRLPDGYRTPLARTPLSGGEAQRLGLARALVRGPKVLLLDDATASLDTVTEARVEDAIAHALPGRTRVVVTHRVATAARADLVAWLDGGRLVAVAPHDVLWERGDYRAVFTGDES